ncbi:olfactory receptor 10A6-like [Cyprinus carpio]|uniref:Olfactory receptor 10A6-like n=1 Tax=Cyprinus carpio TaxID=7962 RepID=A0A9Q9YVS3_CYPCA|nr:olfactory receptor 10A6-like [Cyprinus carpio]
MYLFICNLACINVYGGTAVSPFIIATFLTEHYHITWFSCLVQIYFIYTYGGCDITNLTVMAYDRYISICYPLKYDKIVTPTKVILGIVLTWLMPFFRVTITLSLTANFDICGVIIEKVYCDNYSIVKLACTDILYYNIYSSTMIAFGVVLPFFIIIYSYVKITLICLKLPKRGRVKLFSTCVPHLIALFNFIIGISFELLQSRFDMRHVPYIIRVILSLYFLIFTPLINPIIYGLRKHAIKEAIMRKLCHTFYQRQTV